MKKTLAILSLLALLFTLAACGSEEAPAANGEPTVIKLGVVGESNEAWQVAKKTLADQNIDLQIVSFSDYTLPNQALSDGEIDLNAFQHYAYLRNDCEKNGYDLTVIGETVIAPLGLFSQKISDISELKEGDKIAIPSDVTNGGRSLKVLEGAGVIEVDPAAGYTPFVTDITSNPLNIEFIEVEASLTAGLLPDVTAAMINSGHAVDNGLIPSQDAVYLEPVAEGADNPYINVIVARTEDKDNEAFKKVVAAYQTDEVIKVIEEVSKGSSIPVWTKK
ncbi:MAG: MetQ/NlpA family ABC transporter substrate-binding protein [Ruminococcaceae bacterium]|nr:MetQ/NlpA family ABC transporter substrate-binding protein [Oscillospiraceae bacterium]